MKRQVAAEKSHWTKWVLRSLLGPVLGAVTLCVLLIASLMIWIGFSRVNFGPVLPYFEAQINEFASERSELDVAVTLDDLFMTYDRPTGMLEVEGLGISLSANDGSAMLERAFVKVPVADFPNFTLGPVILSGISLDVHRQSDGNIRINDFEVEEVQQLARLIRADQAVASPPVLINDIDAVVRDDNSELRIPLRGERVDVISLRSFVAVFGELRVRSGDFVGSRIVANLSLPRSGPEGPELQLQLDGFDLSRLGESGLLELPELTLAGATTGSVNLHFERDFSLIDLDGRVSVENGGLSGDALPQDLSVLFAEGSFSYQPEGHEFTLTDIIATGDIWTASLNLNGALEEDENGFIVGFSGVANSLTGSLNAPELFSAPHVFRAEQIPVSLGLTPFFFEVDAANFRLDGVPIEIAGVSEVNGESFDHRYRVRSAPRPVEDVLTFWPRAAVPNTRAWAFRSLKGAELSNIDAAIASVGGRVTVRMGFDYDKLQARLINGFPPVSNARGSALLTESNFTVEIDSGELFFPKERGGVYSVDVAGSRFFIPDITPKIPIGEATIFPKSTLDGAIAVLDHPPFSFLTKAEMTLPNASALVDGELRISLPLQKEIGIDDVDVDAFLTLNNLRSSDLIKGKTIRADRLAVRTNGEVLTATGKARVGASTGDVTMLQNLSEDGLTLLTVRTQLTRELAEEFGFPTDQVALDGAAPLKVDLRLERDQPVAFEAQSNLEGLALSAPVIGWSKRANRAGAVSATGTFSEEATDPIRFAFDAPGLSANGLFEAGQTEIQSAKVGRWFDGSVSLSDGSAPQVYAKRIDLRSMPRGLGGGGGSLQIDADRLIVAENIFLSDLNGAIVPRRIDVFNGRLNGRLPVQITISQTKGGPTYTVTGSDAGTAVSTLGIMQGVKDGTFRVELQETSDGLVGRFELKNIRVQTGSPLIGLLDAISLVGLIQQLDGPGIRFETVRGRFTIAPNGIELRQVNAVGASLGFTTAGIVLPKQNRIDLEGTVTPIYPINGALERTFKRPFGRERGEGLLSFTYRVRGAADDPRVSVNPLSILLPGFLREIVRPKTPTLDDLTD